MCPNPLGISPSPRINKLFIGQIRQIRVKSCISNHFSLHWHKQLFFFWRLSKYKPLSPTLRWIISNIWNSNTNLTPNLTREWFYFSWLNVFKWVNYLSSGSLMNFFLIESNQNFFLICKRKDLKQNCPFTFFRDIRSSES